MRAVHKAHRLFVILILVAFAILNVPVVNGEGPQVYVLRVLHTNDHHAHLDPVKVNGKDYGGVARRKTAIDMIRAAKDNLLLVDAGDVFQGTLYFNQYSGKADLYFYNEMKYDAMVVGNHEFDKGQAPLAEFISGASFSVLGANVQVADSSPLAGKIKPWVIKEVGGQKIGILGVTAEDVGILSNPGPGVTFSPAAEAAKKAVGELTAQGVNKIVMLSHRGFDNDRLVARQISGIDIIVGGHSHTSLGDEPDAVLPYPVVETAPDGSRVVVVQDWEWGKWLGDVSVGFDSDGKVTGYLGKPLPIDDAIQVDSGFNAKLKEYSAQLDQLKSMKIGQSTVKLEGASNIVRKQETNLGNLITDAMLERMRSDGVQMAFMNSGGIRASIEAGDISMGNVLEVLPFGNTLVGADVTGAQVKQALENGVNLEAGTGRFPQVSGLRYTWNPAAAVGSRILSVEVATAGGYKPVDPAAKYRVAINDFLVGGGDGYTAFKASTNQVNTNLVLSDVFADFVKAKSPISSSVAGRIVQSDKAQYITVIPFALAPAAGVTPTITLPSALPKTGGGGLDSSEAWWVVVFGAGVLAGGFGLRSLAGRWGA